jgi:uncharacterized protein
MPLALLGGAAAFVALVVSLFRNGRSGWAWALIAAVGALLFFALRHGRSGEGAAGGSFGGGSGGGGGASGSR